MDEQEKLRVVVNEEERRGFRRFGEKVIYVAPRGAITGFLDFIRERGVMGLAIGFVLGGAVLKVTTSFSTDVLTPSLAYLFGGTEKLNELMLGSVAIGKFIATIIDFFVLALAVYILFKVLKLDRLDKKEE